MLQAAPATGGRTLRAWSMPALHVTAQVNEPSTLAECQR
jgi:hypothetical protein